MWLQNWLERWNALRELRSLEARQWAMAGDDNPVLRAKAALQVGDKEEAQRCWEWACKLFPTKARVSHDAVDLLIDLGRLDEAEDLIRERLRSAPRDIFFMESYAYIAQIRGNLAEALLRWQKVKKSLSVSPRTYREMAACLRQVGKVNEADSLLRKAVRRFPKDVLCHIAYARVADERGDWPEALSRSILLTERTGHILGVLGAAKALTNLGKLREAKALLMNARAANPREQEVSVALARLASASGDWARAAETWADMRKRFPAMAIAYIEEGRALHKGGYRSEAKAILEDARRRFPTNHDVLSEYSCAVKSDASG